MAKCLPVPSVPPIPLPGGISLGATIPLPEFDPALCCKLLPYPFAPKIPIPGLTASLGFLAVISTAIDGANAYLDSLQPKCPR